MPLSLAAAAGLSKLAVARLLPGPWLFSDATLYAREAASLAARGLEALRSGAQEYTILYPLLLAPAFGGASRADAHQAALAINAVVSTSALFPQYWIARRVLPPPIAGVLAAVLAFLPSTFAYALALSSENLFQPLFWWGTFFLLRLAQRDRAADAVGAGVAIGLLPVVKLTGFAILAAAAVLAVGMAVFHRVDGRRAAACLAALTLPQVVWIALRATAAGPERGLFGFGPGVGEALVAGLRRLASEGWRPFAAYFVGETTYFVVGAYVAWLAFSVYLVTQYRTWQSRSIEGFLLLWTFLAAASLVLVTVLLLFPIAQVLTDPDQRARPIYGRFIEVLFPAFFILGTRGMLDFAWKEGPSGLHPPRRPRRELVLMLLAVVFTAISFYPLTRYAVSGPLREHAFALLGLAGSAGVLLLLVLLPSVAAGVWILGRPERGRRGALALALASVLALHAMVFGVTVVGVVAGARERDARLFRIGHWLEGRAGRATRVAYDESLGFGDQYFAYRFWSEARWEPTPPERLTETGADYVVTKRRLELPVLAREANGVTLYSGS